jgi:hypothetical protein
VGPATAQQTATYIVLSNAYSGRILKSNLAHEFFHALQAKYNRRGTRWYTGPLFKDPAKFWFVEASAMWAEQHFVPDAANDPDGPHRRFTGRFLTTNASLALTDGRNDYASWPWPLFMEQEIGNETAISDAWKKMVGLAGYDSLQEAVSSVVPFDTRFRDFAVRVYNTDLEPGNPVDPRFQALDQTLPLDKPGGSRGKYDVPVVVDDPLPQHAADLAPLWSSYTGLLPAADVHKITFDFSFLMPPEAVDVDLLLQIKGRWQRTKAALTGEQAFCDVDRAIVVISNHATDMDTRVNGQWFATGENTTCAPEAWTVSLTGPKAGAGVYTGNEESYCGYAAGVGWTGIVYLDPNGAGVIRHISVGDNGFLINTSYANDDPTDWGTITLPGYNAHTTLTGDSSAAPPHLIGDSTWTIPPEGGAGTPGDYHVHVDIACTTYDGP